MAEQYEPKSVDHLVDLIILNKTEGMPSYALFLGAGASRNSNIKTADEMIDTWRNQLYQREKARMRYSTWLAKQSWYKSEDEYGALFGELYDEASQRRDHIEKCMENAHPTWGYAYLASLLQNNIFNAVFTTNFDDLINEACYLYSDNVRPIVYAHDTAVINIRISQPRAKIVKLHGDFLFENIKNTSDETYKLEDNMQKKLAQFALEYGLIVIGYGGRDNSVMSVLEDLLEKNDYFRHGVYWCIQKGANPADRVKNLIKKDRAHAIEIAGFDEFMATLHHKAGINLPVSLIDPMQVAENRTKLFCTVPSVFSENEFIRKDIEKVLDGLGKIPNQNNVPLNVKAAISRKDGDLPRALEYMKLAVEADKDDYTCAYEYADIMARLNMKQEILDFVPTSALNDDNKTYFLLYSGDNDFLVEFSSKILDRDPTNSYARINRAIANKRLGHKKEMDEDLKELEEKEIGESVRAGVAALRGNKEELLRLLDISIDKKLISIDNLKIFPVFEDYQQDEDFKKYIIDKTKK